MTRPNLDDPAELAEYRRELRRLHREWRWGGLAILLIGVAIMLARGEIDMLSLSLLTLGWVILIAVIIRRTRYHRRRMRGDHQV